ncbi:hypothetical protein [Flavobacterium sp. MDT1-60]|uniref:hypothetical protein n=1 Tax=Flavobacterium sp. MDT1-60 TaxID=1979344 RepID=UPI001785C096|nr:hypothetical protein [Flavobacterium sp. MDT1-60]QOG03272.1 hypothetical protein IHE43_03250 [Flavobacterium sp. MDT1-60]
MEILIKLISFTLVISLIIFPIFILKQLYKRKTRNIIILYFTFCLIITFLLVLTVAWWSYFSNQLLLSHYGYNFDDLDTIERLQNVAPENLDRIKKLRMSMMGIGWPLKAFMVYPFYFVYLVIVYSVLDYQKNKTKK